MRSQAEFANFSEFSGPRARRGWLRLGIVLDSRRIGTQPQRHGDTEKKDKRELKRVGAPNPWVGARKTSPALFCLLCVSGPLWFVSRSRRNETRLGPSQ